MVKSGGIKKLLSSLAVGFTALSILAVPAYANTKKPQEPKAIVETVEEQPSSLERKLTLDYADPITNVEANSNAWYSATQLVGKLSDKVVESPLDDNFIGRVALFTADYYALHVLRFFSHEGGHIREGEKFDGFTWDVDWQDYVDINNNFPKHHTAKRTTEEILKSNVAGLNQDEFNSYNVFQNNQTDLSFDNAMSFLLTKLWDVKYNLTDDATLEDGHDIKNYIYNANKLGIETSEDDHLMQAVVADVLSMYTWDSLRSIKDYLVHGKKSITPSTFEVGDQEFTYPLINFYLTTKGGFYNITSFMNPNSENPLELNLGTDIDFIGDGDVNHLRFGAKYHNLKMGDDLFSVSPFAYINTTKSAKFKGISYGVEMIVPITDSFELRGKLEYNQNDILESEIKDEGNGANAVVGFNWYF